jgi:hypothetical protein
MLNRNFDPEEKQTKENGLALLPPTFSFLLLRNV